MSSPADRLRKKITPEQRRQSLAMAARGDSDVSIAQVIGISAQSVSHIKKRNEPLLKEMRNTVDSYRAQKATDILDKSENLIIRKLNKALDAPADTLTLDELQRIAKTSYERVRLEQGRATSISASDTTQPIKSSQMDLEALVEAIKSKDEVKLQQIVFSSKEQA